MMDESGMRPDVCTLGSGLGTVTCARHVDRGREEKERKLFEVSILFQQSMPLWSKNGTFGYSVFDVELQA